MRLTANEQAMLDGREGKAKQKAMELLVRYAEALGAVVTGVPTVTDLDGDPLALIESGDWVRVDGDAGTVEIFRKVP